MPPDGIANERSAKLAKRSCKRTPEERAVHDEAVRLRKMTDTQLVAAFGAVRDGQDDRLETLIAGIEAGEVKGVKGGTAYKIVEYAKDRGLLR